MRAAPHQLDLMDPGDETSTTAWDPTDQPLREVTFCVVDLETTGGSATEDRITEIGAVTVRGGEVLGEFGTLVDDGTPVPPAITGLTGISTSMLAGAPSLGAALAAYLEFSAGAVLVAHNAGFDTGFLRSACRRTGRPWHSPPVVDTVRLARAVLTRDDTPDHRLATLARLLGATTQPCHRALDDARATVDVLHALIARLPEARTLGDLIAVSRGAVPAQARKRHLARDVPRGPGVYVFHGQATPGGPDVLYVGSSGDLRPRVRQYFTRGEPRRRMAEMVARSVRVQTIACPTVLEARVRELRLIARHRPPYNRRSREPGRAVWLVLTTEAFPRPALVRSPGGRPPLAAFAGRGEGGRALQALLEVSGLRHCTARLPLRGGGSACVTGQIGRCRAPCVTGTASGYDEVVSAARQGLGQDLGPLLSSSVARTQRLAARGGFEAAAVVVTGMETLARGVDRAQRVASLRRLAWLTAAKRDRDGGWELVCVRDGRFAGSARTPRGHDPRPMIEVLAATADGTTDPTAAAPDLVLLEEADLLWRWLCQPGVRLVDASDGWWLPRGAARAWQGEDGALRWRSRVDADADAATGGLERGAGSPPPTG